MPAPEQDPWDWSIEELVEALTASTGLIKTLFPRTHIDLSTFANALRDNEMEGQLLLTLVYEDRDCLREYFGISIPGQRQAILMVVRDLQKASQKFQLWRATERGSELAPIYVGPHYPSPQLSNPAILSSTNGALSLRSAPEAPRLVSQDLLDRLQDDTKDHLTLAPPESTLTNVDTKPVTAVGGHEVGTKLRTGENLTTGSDGRSRRRLQLVAPAVSEPAILMTEAGLLTPAIDDTKRLAMGEHTSSSTQFASDVYLGAHAIPVDDLFFGLTEIGHEVELGDSADSLQESSEFLLLPRTQEVGVGYSRYVHSRMKHFLVQNNAAELRIFKRRKYHAFGIKPYPDRLLKTGHAPSITILSGPQYGAKPFRMNGNLWKESDPQAIDSAFLPFNPSRIDPDDLAVQQSQSSPHEFSFLDKYLDTEEDSSLLPAYGDSGSEDEDVPESPKGLVEEDEDEMAEEELETGKQLTLSEVSDIVRSCKADIQMQWRLNKLPRLAKGAFKIWHEARSRKAVNKIAYLERDIVHLDKRLTDIETGIHIVIWDNVKDVTDQCKSLESTVEDRCKSEWILSVLLQKEAPLRPEENGRAVVRNQKVKSTNSGEREELSPKSDSGMGDFIVDDEGSGLPQSLDDRSQPIETNQLLPDASKLNDPPEDLTEGSGASVDGALYSPQYDHDVENGTEPPPDDMDITDPGLASKPNRPRGDIFELPQSRSTSPVGKWDDNPQLERNEDRHDVATGCESESESRSSPDSLIDPIKEEPEDPNGASSDDSMLAPGEVIDLTQVSDDEIIHDQLGARPISRQVTTMEAPVEAPMEVSVEAPIESPKFMSSGQARPVFKEPPTSRIMKEAKSAKDYNVSDVTGEKPSMIISEAQEAEEIAKSDPEELMTDGDSRKILIFILYHTKWSRLLRAQKASNGCGADEISPKVSEGLRILKGHGERYRSEEDPDISAGLMDICYWYVCWLSGRIPDEKGLRVAHVKSALASIESSNDDFAEYYEFLHDRLVWHNEHGRNKSKDLHEPFTKRKQEEEFSSRSHKKRKNAVKESQVGIDLQNAAFARSRERERRKQQVRKMQQNSQNQELQATKFINPGKRSDEGLVALNPQIAQKIQPHQVEGVEFMWSETVIAEAGCLLAHPMGLGKTMQVITLLVTIAEAANHADENVRKQIPSSLRRSQTLVLCPASLADNWADELLKWIPEKASDMIGEVRKVTSNLLARDRLYEIQLWANDGGILILSYNLFRDLLSGRLTKEGQRILTNEEQDRVNHSLLKVPNLVVADEAQEFKNTQSKISLTVNQLQTECRIALTGSPLNNNLEEYYNIINWVQKDYLGDLIEFRAKYVEPISEGLYVDASNAEKRRGLKMLKVLTRVLKPKMDRADYSVLDTQLHGKTEFVIRVCLTELQDRCYRLYVARVLSGVRGDNEPSRAAMWAWMAVLKVLNNHPKAFYRCMVTKHEETPKKRAPPKLKSNAQLEEASQELAQNLEEFLGTSLIQEQLEILKAVDDLDRVALSHKMELLFEILKGCNGADEKVLIFSHSLATLDFIEDKLKTMSEVYHRVDGNSKVWDRQNLTKVFNAGGRAVCLISTRAGGTGLNFYGASRVIIVDEHFNPMHERQAIGRAYRIGQKKHVYIYRLVIGGTFEETLQNQALFKEGLVNRVVDRRDTIRNAQKGVRDWIFNPVEQPLQDLSEFQGMDPLVLDHVLADQEKSPYIRSIKLAESFLVEEEELLTVEEMKEADEIEKDEHLRLRDPHAYAVMLNNRAAKAARTSASGNGTLTGNSGLSVKPHPRDLLRDTTAMIANNQVGLANAQYGYPLPFSSSEAGSWEQTQAGLRPPLVTSPIASTAPLVPEAAFTSTEPANTGSRQMQPLGRPPPPIGSDSNDQQLPQVGLEPLYGPLTSRAWPFTAQGIFAGAGQANNIAPELQPILGAGVKFNRPEGTIDIIDDYSQREPVETEYTGAAEWGVIEPTSQKSVEAMNEEPAEPVETNRTMPTTVDEPIAPGDLLDFSGRNEAPPNEGITTSSLPMKFRSEVRLDFYNFVNRRFQYLASEGKTDSIPMKNQQIGFVKRFERAAWLRALLISNAAELEKTYIKIFEQLKSRLLDDDIFINEVFVPLKDREEFGGSGSIDRGRETFIASSSSPGERATPVLSTTSNRLMGDDPTPASAGPSVQNTSSTSTGSREDLLVNTARTLRETPHADPISPSEPAPQYLNLVDALSTSMATPPMTTDGAADARNVGDQHIGMTSLASYPTLAQLIEREKTNSRIARSARGNPPI